MNSHNIMHAINEIAGASGKNDKIELLQRHMVNPEFLEVLNLALNPFITFGQRPGRYTGFAGTFMWDENTVAMLMSMASRDLTGNAAQAAMQAEFSRLEEQSAELLWRVINKDLKAGFGENSVNKVKKDFIPSFSYMRCSLPKDAKLDTWPWNTGAISQIKADGMFFNADIDASFVNFTSRQGQPFPGEGFEALAQNFKDAFAHLLVDDHREGIQTHGELLVEDEHGQVLPREVGNGMINKLIQGSALPPGHNLTALLWDVVPKENTGKKGKYEVPYLQRLRLLNSAVGMLQAKREHRLISVIETRVVRSYEEAMAHYMDARRRKLEGTIVKKPTMIWKDGTSKDQVKLKQEVPVELEVYGFEEGKPGAKTCLTFGALKTRTKCGLLKVDVGTGFSDELRREINEAREEWIGAIITVKGNEIMVSKDGKKEHSIFLPVYVERRLDKNEADTYEQVVAQFEAAVK
ncbi:DNA ligase [Pseudomonas phage nickie]|uniref:DNA ligase n=1 Tax=Pseudomonas phage nickie TaxID=2048977 RepID=A0A2H4P729_9CAUD|nr:DNA ligase [Pseudomonas phage nickie]ATW57992.1 DNA ligase [Pseudomonas phage nickie]